MTTADSITGSSLTTADPDQAAAALEHILATGDLARLSPKQRVAHYLHLCRSLGLNSVSRPFDWLMLDGKLVLYPNKSCAEQLRRQHHISVRVTRKETCGDRTEEPMFVVEVEGSSPDGRTDFATKYVPLTGVNREGQRYRLAGRELANAYHKAETGAKRRLVLSMVGLAAPSDVEDAGSVQYVVVDAHGNVIDRPTDIDRYLASQPAAARAINGPTFETTASADDAPLAGEPADQGARPEELERPKRGGPRPTFKPSQDDVRKWVRTWHATVAGTSLDNDHERHRFVEQWTDGRTPSLPAFFETATDRQAEDLLAHVRALVEDEKRATAESGQEAEPEQEAF